MAGGGGTRLWPASRKQRPKQFLPMLDGGETLLGATVARVQGIVPAERILVVTAADQVAEVQRTAPSVPRDNIVVEPQARNTAPCIGLGALEVLRRDPGGRPGRVAVRSMDPRRRRLSRCGRARARRRARAAPSSPSASCRRSPRPASATSSSGDATERDARVVDRFVEKPDLPTAKQYLAGRRYLWNSGMFFFAAKRLARSGAHAHARARRDPATRSSSEPERVRELYPKAPSVSIDYGVMEKLPRGDVFCVPGDFGWNDVGSWSALGELRPADARATSSPATR